ncbi:MAG: gamma-glutamyl-gamma-aminobutyrate hydrolase family protein [candidate division Zixibacteria bacterium]|nr:gamma-glutamyl-gamma-aminobutyrate hydrolase family protein [candidate division KSB1 bacterium]NIT72390.1 gamma-glutamyl-gamma-aminobutyrate hydrolase family protein [candidate division KSB1 bacterium]NIV07205.1 gamma-glutamyl-gamma-aminobutyrate hydrolase family protein [candidate division Zixibacteria bacterium]NIX72070.1 gamma-glutamyl-gamma-aminobutyrate hydrolase family protein [candidate division KSB1 bacterium]
MIQPNRNPIIGITTYGRSKKSNYYLPDAYVDAVRAAGGIPFLMPPGETEIDQLLQVIDGLVLAGGGDIAPDNYGGKDHPKISEVDPERDRLELEIARKVLQLDIPVLGICRGQQVLNVVTGGNLIEHIPDQFGERIIHRSEKEENIEHPVKINSDSQLAKILDVSSLSVVSKHHQGIGKVTAVWRIVAHADDGVIEAQEHKQHPWKIGVQWHPEITYRDPIHLRLFQAHVEAAQQRNSSS